MLSSDAAARGRVLVVGTLEVANSVVHKLSGQGFSCRAVGDAEALIALANEFQPEAVLLTDATAAVREPLAALRSSRILRELPVLVDVSRGDAAQARALGVDDWIHSEDELQARLEAALRARRLVERDQLSRLRMEMLLEITHAATSSLELDQILAIAVEKVGRVVAASRCSVVLVEGQAARQATVVATREEAPSILPLKLDLARYPELRRALETRQTVLVEDAGRDPLMGEVRELLPPELKSILVQPLICQDDLLGALFLRLSRTQAGFRSEELEFAVAVAAALANSVRNARLHQALRRKREELESAYVDRYRELTDANRRLKELNRLKDELIAVLSHDLRSPLNVLLGHGRLLLETGLGPQETASVEAMNRQGKKILEMVESLLERGKGDLTRFSLDARKVDISELAIVTARELEILGAERGIAVRTEAPESLPLVGDEVKLREVLDNLIGNAIRHAPQNGEVVVKVQRQRRPDGDVARVVVQDNGAGIPKDQLQLVFDRYRHGPGGTGLGLAICKEFVELHGGEIWAESEGPGAQLIFTLPMAPEATPQRVPEVPGDERELPRVLVVEDEPEVAAVVAEVLRVRYRVEVARDGAEGLAKARALLPDLVVMDVFLPRLDGLDAAAALKSAPETRDIPLILLSAHQGVADKLRALNLGAVDYLAKPFQSLQLLACADRALKLRATERELQRSQSMLRRIGSDPETGLYDRGGLVMRLEQELSRSKRYGRPLCVALLRPQEPLGERTRQVAALLREVLRAPDVIAHLGQGTFALALPESGMAEASGMLQRLLPRLETELGLKLRPLVLAAGRDDRGDTLLDRLTRDAPTP